MTKFWFIAAPLPGHLDWGGLLKTAQTLHAQGHDVTWVSGDSIRGMVRGIPFAAIDQTGWRWPPPPLPTPATFINENMVTLRFRRALDTWLTEDLVAQGTQAILDLADRDGPPELIVTDPFLASSALAAEKLGVPLAVGGWASGPPLDADEMLFIQRQLGAEASERIERLSARFGVDGVNFSDGPAPAVQSPQLHISYFNAYWHQGESVLPQTEFVGGVVSPPDGDPPGWLAEIPADQRIGMVTLGSVFNDDFGFFIQAARAIADAAMVPLAVIGFPRMSPPQREQLKASLPGGTRLLNWVDFDHVFPRLSVIVHHGGMGTTHAAIVHGIPQVIAPRGADQRSQAKRAARAKVGLELSPQDIWRGQLPVAVKAITTTDWVLEAVARLAREFAALGGVVRAAELLVRMSLD
jgi:UDP:flavonoid glycosyltransferase YjiC (YdhE family)